MNVSRCIIVKYHDIPDIVNLDPLQFCYWDRRRAERGSEWAVARKPISLNLRKSRKGVGFEPPKRFRFARFRVKTELLNAATLKECANLDNRSQLPTAVQRRAKNLSILSVNERADTLIHSSPRPSCQSLPIFRFREATPGLATIGLWRVPPTSAIFLAPCAKFFPASSCGVRLTPTGRGT